MANVIGDICAPLGKYIKDGEEKTRWGRCGVLLHTEKGYRIKLDMVPTTVGDQGLWLNVFEKDDGPPRQQKPAQTAAEAPQQGSLDGGKEKDVPF